MLESVLMLVLTISLSLFSCFVAFYFIRLKYLKPMQPLIKQAMSLMGSNKKPRIPKKVRNDVNEAVDNIVEGLAMDDPRVALAMQLLERFAPDLEIDAMTISAFMQHPLVRNLMQGFMKPMNSYQEPQQQIGGGYGESRYQLRKKRLIQR